MLKGFYNKKYSVVYYLIFSLVILTSVIVFNFFPPTSQSLEHHNFADTRSYYGISNFYNVVSSLASTLVALIGVVYLGSSKFKGYTSKIEKNMYLAFFGAIILTSLGSAYYHWNPNTTTLFWDRLFLIVSLMIFQSIIIAERISIKIGKLVLIPLILLGVFSVIHWRYTETNEVGDLRLYGLINFLLPVVVALMLWKLPSPYTNSAYLWEAFSWFTFAHVVTFLDKNIYNASNQLISGHTLKHVSFAFATFAVLKYLKKRTVLGLR